MNKKIKSSKSHYKVMVEIDFHRRFHLLHYRLYDRARKIFAFILLLTGTGAFISAMNNWPLAIKITAAIVAAITIGEYVMDLPSRITHHAQLRRRYSELAVRGPSLDSDVLDDELAKIAIDDDKIIDALRAPAMNDTLRSLGHVAQTRPLTFSQWFMDLIA